MVAAETITTTTATATATATTTTSTTSIHTINNDTKNIQYNKQWEKTISSQLDIVLKNLQNNNTTILNKPLDYNKCWLFYNQQLQSAKYILAPMVNQSELPFRMLCRQYNAQLCYTPMLNAKSFVNSKHYRDTEFTTCNDDKPLIVQLCGHNANTILQAVQYIEHDYSNNLPAAIDINMGCPQNIAKRGLYGAYIMYRPDICSNIVSTLYNHSKLPVTCKIRIFNNYTDTYKFVRILQYSGCSMIVIHGRTKEQNKHLVGSVDLDIIKRLKAESDIYIPIIANGGIHTVQDANYILDYTKCDGVMSSEGILSNPALFSNQHIDSIIVAKQYIQLTKQYNGADSSCIRGHLFKILHHRLTLNTDIRNRLGSCKPDEFELIINELYNSDILINYIQPNMYSKLHWYHRHLSSIEKQQHNNNNKKQKLMNSNNNNDTVQQQQQTDDITTITTTTVVTSNDNNTTKQINIDDNTQNKIITVSDISTTSLSTL